MIAASITLRDHLPYGSWRAEGSICTRAPASRSPSGRTEPVDLRAIDRVLGDTPVMSGQERGHGALVVITAVPAAAASLGADPQRIPSQAWWEQTGRACRRFVFPSA